MFATSIVEPDFVFILVGQLILLALFMLVVGYVVFRAIDRHKTSTITPIKVILAALAVLLILILAGWLSEIAGL